MIESSNFIVKLFMELINIYFLTIIMFSFYLNSAMAYFYNVE